MTGSEKQIKWAEDIKSNLIRVYTGAAENCPSDGAKYRAMIEKLESVDRASLIIAMFGQCSFNGDLAHDFRQVAFAFQNPDVELSVFVPEM